MTGDELKRKLAAILSADVAGYSRLMGEDEEATVRQLTGCRDLLADLIGNHGGRVVDTPGDNLLAEFDSVVDSLRCSWQIQLEIGRINELLPENRRMQFRIGINLGDIIEQDGRLYGDGVNVAARLEGLAEPGGINISGTAYDQVKRKVPYDFLYSGEHQVKNIADPVRVYRLDPATASPGQPLKKGRAWPKHFSPLLAIGLAVLATLLAAGIYIFSGWQQERADSERSHTASAGEERLAQGASVAVLPFANLSSDHEQEYFSDGITNDIITDLSRFHDLLVIASNTVFSFKGKKVNIQEIARQLDVRYILEGSVQKVGEMVRINAQLIDAADGTHVWADRYERAYSEIFALQEELVRSIVTTLAVNISQTERERAMRKAPQDLNAYDYLLRGWAYYYQRTRASNRLAAEMFEKASRTDPRYGAAYVGLGWTEYSKVGYGWTEFPQKALENAFEYGKNALSLDSNNASAHALLCNVYTFKNQYELAIHAAEQALAINPNDAYTYGQMGWALLWAGRLDEAIDALEMSLRLDSTTVRNVWMHLGMAHYLQNDFVKALELLEKGVVRRPDFVGYYIGLAATYARLERAQDAAGAAASVLRLDPFFEADSFGTAFRDPEHRRAIAEGLEMAGL